MWLKWRLAQYLEQRWWRRYLQGKSPEDYLEWKSAYWRGFLQHNQIDFERHHMKILDAGCGPAGINIVLQDHQLTAIDPLLDKYKDLHGFFDEQARPWVTFISSTLEDFHTSESFDMVFCLNVINHVADIKISTKCLFNHCKPNGRLVISVDAHRCSGVKHLFQWIPGDMLHPHQLDLQGYIDLLTEAGFIFERALLYKRERIFDYWVIHAIRPPHLHEINEPIAHVAR